MWATLSPVVTTRVESGAAAAVATVANVFWISTPSSQNTALLMPL
jgi:hypothetical protein